MYAAQSDYNRVIYCVREQKNLVLRVTGFEHYTFNQTQMKMKIPF